MPLPKRKKPPAKKPAKKKKSPAKKPAPKKKPVAKVKPAKIKKVVRTKKVAPPPAWQKGPVENTAPYTEAETNVLTRARAKFPKLGQEELATKLYTQFHTLGKGLVNRTRVSIYSALRRLDTKLAKGTAPRAAAARKASGKGKPKAGAKKPAAEDGGTKKGQPKKGTRNDDLTSYDAQPGPSQKSQARARAKAKKPAGKRLPEPGDTFADGTPKSHEQAVKQPKKATAIQQIHDPMTNTVAEVPVKEIVTESPAPGDGGLPPSESTNPLDQEAVPEPGDNVGTIGRLDGETPVNPDVGTYTDPNDDSGHDPFAEGREAFDGGWDETRNPYQPTTPASASWNDGYAAAKREQDEGTPTEGVPVTKDDEEKAWAEAAGHDAPNDPPEPDAGASITVTEATGERVPDGEDAARESGEIADDEEFTG